MFFDLVERMGPSQGLEVEGHAIVTGIFTVERYSFGERWNEEDENGIFDVRTRG